MQPPPKRQLRPTASLPTTAEKYGAQFGLPDELQAALQNVGRKGRQAIAQGRSFDRTQSYPAFSPSSDFSHSAEPLHRGFGGFQTASETYADAQRLLNKDQMKERELQPYSNKRVGRSLSPEGQSSGQGVNGDGRKLQFDQEGNVVEEGISNASGSDDRHRRAALSKGTKRFANQDGAGGSDTEVDEDPDELPSMDTSGSTLHTNSHENDDFPPVFISPKITQPELFSRPAIAFPSRMNGNGGRVTKGLPGNRGWGKTVSMPVGSFGSGAGGGGGGDVEMEDGGGDGFDVSEWAKGEEF